MRRFVSVLALTLVVVVSVHADENKKDLQAIQGVWLVIQCVGDGKELPDKVIKDMKLTSTDDRVTVTGGEFIRGGDDLFKIDARRQPGWMDFVAVDGPLEGKSRPAIYQLERETLKLCFPLRESRKRPTEFESPETFQLGL